MGLSGPAVDAIGREHAYKPITGDVLFIGRQTTYFTPKDLVTRLRDHCTEVDESAIEIDRTTVNRNSADQLVTDRSIFHALGNRNVRALDVSDYEGAEVVHNLNLPVPDRLRECADFLVDGSTLDNVFDPAMALRNFNALLRPGGRMLLINAWNTRETAYTLCSAAWYFDYLVANGYVDVRVYGGVFSSTAGNAYWLDHSFMAREIGTPIILSDEYAPFLVVFGEKAIEPRSEVIPTQSHYRSPAEWAAYRDNLRPVLASRRPHLMRSIGKLLPRRKFRGFLRLDGEWQIAQSEEQASLVSRIVRSVRDTIPVRA